MSLINEALKQAQNQNQSGSGPVGIPVYHPTPQKNLRSDILVILLVCGILIVLLGGALFGIIYSQSKKKSSVAKTSEAIAAPTAATISSEPNQVAQSSLGKAREKTSETIKRAVARNSETKEELPVAAIVILPPAAPTISGSTPPSPALIPSSSSQNKPGIEKATASGEVNSGPSPAIVKLKAMLKLTGIIGKQGAFMALINNRLVRKGDEIEGAIITGITADQVQLNLNGEFLEISIKLTGSL